MKRFITRFYVLFILSLISGSVFAQLSGSYVIPGSYASFTAAVAALKSNGVSGPVTFTVAAGTYTERLELPAITGASATNTITFEGVSKTTRIIQYSGTSANRATIAFQGGDYFRFKNFSIRATSGSYGIAAHFRNGSDYNIIENCDLRIVSTSTSSNFIPVVASCRENSYSCGGNNGNYNLIKNCHIMNGYFGLTWRGSNTTTVGMGNQFVGNEFDNQYYYAMYLYYNGNQKIIGNTIHKMRATTSYGIMNYYGSGDTITENIIIAGYYALYNFYQNYYFQSKKGLVANNFTTTTYPSYSYGLYAYYNYNVNYYHNTCWLKPTTSNVAYASARFYYCNGCNVKNNIFMNTGNGSAVYTYQSNWGAGAFDYNDIYSTGNNYVYWEGSAVGNFAALQAAGPGQNQNSWSQNPQLVSFTDPHWSANGNYMIAPSVGIMKDIDGDPRGAGTMIGVDHVKLPGLDVSMIRIDSPVVFADGNNSLKVTFNCARDDSVRWVDLGFILDNGIPVTVNNYFPPKTMSLGERHSYTFQTPLFVPKTSTGYKHELKVWVNAPNDSVPDYNINNDTLIISFCTGVEGTYTIGPTGDFTTINAALSLFDCGIVGPITFNIQPGTYNQAVYIDKIQGASATMPIIFDGGSATSVTLSSLALSTIDFDGAEYVTFKNMTINAGTYNAVWFHNGAKHVTVENCIINANTTTSSSAYNAVLASTIVSSYSGYGDNANYCTIQNNTITGGYCGVVLNGPSTTSTSYGNIIRNNIFTNQYNYGIRLYYAGGTLVEGNTISNFRFINSYAIYSFYGRANQFDANFIKPATWGIYVNYENYYGLSSDSSSITNNMIMDFQNTVDQRGINLEYYCFRTNVYHNTVRVTGSSPAATFNSTQSSFAFRHGYDNAGGNKIMNNIFYSTNKTYLVNLYYSRGAMIDNNDYFHPNSTTHMFYVYFPETKFYDLNSFRSFVNINIIGAHDANSIEKDPEFKSSTDLHLDSGFPPLRGVRTWVSKDVDGDKRCKYLSTLGADESSFPIAPPTAGFALGVTTSDTLCFGSSYTFMNIAGPKDPSGHWWFFNGSLVTTDLNYTHSFLDPDIDTVMLVTENCGGIDTITKIYVIDTPQYAPICDFITSENLMETYWPITFFDYSQNCATSWKWTVEPDSIYDPDFGMIVPTITYLPSDPTNPLAPPTTDTSQVPVVSFDYPGTYSICLEASNLRGNCKICKQDYVIVKASQYMCQYVFPSVEKSLLGLFFDDGGPTGNYQDNVNNPPCQFRLNPCAEEISIKFNEFKVVGGDYLKIFEGQDNTGVPLWDVSAYGITGLTGDMTDPAFDTVYTSNSGELYFEWTSNSSQNDSGWAAEWYGIKGNFPKPVAAFDGPDTACLGTMIKFISDAKGDNLEYSWDCDDDGFADYFGPDCECYYFFPSIYVVVLNVHNCGGDSTIKKTIAIVQPPAAPDAEFEADIRRPVAGADIVSFSDVSKPSAINLFGCSDQWQWEITPITREFVLGTNESFREPLVRFDDTGCYDVKFTAGYNGYYDSDSESCYIYAIRYCIPEVTNLNPDIGISRVIISKLDNTSPIGSNEYTDFSNSASTYLDLEAKYKITIERNSAFNTMNRKVWIDYNTDGDFEDAGELVASEAASMVLSWSDSIEIPADAREGATRMRIGTSLGSMSNTPCGINTYGEFEDYRIIIRKDGTPPVITLIGPDTVIIEQCDKSYVDSGATALDNLDGILTPYMKDTTNYNSSVAAGTYFWTYFATDSNNNTGYGIRTIIVTPDEVVPELSLAGKLVDTIDVYTTYTDPGYTADDTCSGLQGVTIDGAVNTSEVGEYKITYKATDNLGNFSQASRIVYVLDREDPIITLNGLDTIYLEVHDTFKDDGVTISDNYWMLDQSNVIKTGSVDESELGDYLLTYSITDSSGNGPVTVSRLVTIIDVRSPVVISATYSGEPIIEDDTIVIEVYDVFTQVDLNIEDNYWKTFTIETTGSYFTNFPTGDATSLGEYDVIYTITDGSGNIAFIRFVIKVIDSQKPVISLVGAQFNNICRFAKFEGDSAYATDNYDNNLTITKGGTYITDYLVNMRRGMYNITYNTVDNSSNVADEVVRYINVENCFYSIADGGLEEYIKLYPNPNEGQFIIEVDLPKAQNISIKVHNTLGELIRTENERNSTGGVYEIDLGNVSNGIYFVKIQTDDETVVHSVTVTK